WTCSCPRSLVVSRLVAGCLSRHPDSNQHLVSNQSAERTDQRPVPAKPPSSHRVTAQDARFSPQFGAAVRMATNRKVPCRLGHAWRSSFDEALWACRTELAAGAPETPYRPEHELAAGLFVEQGKAVGQQVLEGEMLPSHLFQEAAPRLLRRADECWQRAQRIECSRKPPVVEVRTPHTRVHMFRRRSDADRMTRPDIKFGQEIIQEHETIRHKRRSNAIDVVVDPAQGLPRILSMPSELTGPGGAGAVVAHRARRRPTSAIDLPLKSWCGLQAPHHTLRAIAPGWRGDVDALYVVEDAVQHEVVQHRLAERQLQAQEAGGLLGGQR